MTISGLFVLQVVKFCSLLQSVQMSSIMRAVQFAAGSPEKMYIGDVPVPTLRQKEVLLKVYASAVNRADTLQRKGLYPPPAGESDILGLEAVGIIDRLGPECSDDWKRGDRVMALLPGGGNAEYVACREECLIRIPRSMTFNTAAAIPEVWLTAYQILHTVGHVKSGDNVLIHAGGSGVGTAATQLSVLTGASPIVTAGSKAKIDVALSLGATAGFNYKEEDFGQSVKEITKGIGANLILDCIGESFYDRNMEAIADDGTWVVYGLLGGGKINADLLSKMLRKRITITGTTLRIRPIQYKKSLIQNFTKDAIPHFESGRLKPIIDKVFPFEDMGKAHQYMEDNRNTGKIIIKIRDEEKDEL